MQDCPEIIDHRIRINSIGYLPNQRKQASILAQCEVFSVVNTVTGEKEFTGTMQNPQRDNDTGHELCTADFTDLQSEGLYYLEIPGIGRSAEFRIASDVYRFPFYVVTRAMYLWRCGTEVSAEHNGNRYHQNACHVDDGYLDYVQDTVSAMQHKDGAGGWHDAGDYNKYVVNAGISVGSMLLAWEMFSDRLCNINLDIPASGNLPDYLAEIKWELDWLLKMQADNGSVYHKLTALRFCPFIPPDQEKERRYFTPWSSAATADFIAMTAMAARIYCFYDEVFSDKCLAAAIKSYNFLLQYPDNVHADLSPFRTGGYDTNDNDDRLWAYAELWETTGEARFHKDFLRRLTDFNVLIDTDWDWGNVKNLATLRYLLSSREKDKQIYENILAGLITAADTIVDVRNQSGYARPLIRHYWGCNGTVARQTMVLSVANYLQPNREYVETGLNALGYLFGRNPYNRSFVTGLGYNPPMHPHDRRSGSDGIDDPWPGYLVGGANHNAMDWHDEQLSHETNEIAINWNTALIYALAWFV